MRAASLNRHDLWTLRGVGIEADRFPMILGCDGAGVTDDGRDVVIYPIIGQPGFTGDETIGSAADSAHRDVPGHVRRVRRGPRTGTCCRCPPA